MAPSDPLETFASPPCRTLRRSPRTASPSLGGMTRPSLCLGYAFLGVRSGSRTYNPNGETKTDDELSSTAYVTTGLAGTFAGRAGAGEASTPCLR